jgi:hypothetical protein
MTRILTLDNPGTLPFQILDPWPLEDQTVASVSIGVGITVLLPHGNLLRNEVDPLTHLISESNRVLEPGGTLQVKAPYYLSPHGIGNPFQQRIYSEATWYAYGCPETTPNTVTVKDEETGEVTCKEKSVPINPNDHSWLWWNGTDFGVRMRVLSVSNDDAHWTVFYRKFNEGEYEG